MHLCNFLSVIHYVGTSFLKLCSFIYCLQLFFVLCCFTSVECCLIPPFNHVHMLTEMVNTDKQVT